MSANTNHYQVEETRRAIEAAGLPILLPYQQAWVEDESPLVLMEKSRRIGITYATAWGHVESRLSGRRRLHHYFASADESAAEEMALYVGDIARSLNEVFKVAGGGAFPLHVIDEEGIKKFVVEIPIGSTGKMSRFVAQTSNPTRFRSKGGDVTCDEIAFHRDPAAMLKAALPCIDWGGQFRGISTHNGDHNPFNVEVAMGRRRRDGEAKPGDRPYSLHTVTIVDAIGQGLVETINRVRGTRHTRESYLADLRAKAGSDFNEEYMCIPSGEESSYFPSSLTRPCATVDQDAIIERVGDGVNTPRAVWFSNIARLLGRIAARSEGASALYVGVDVGRSVDRFVIWVIAKFGETYRTVGVLVWQDMPFEAMEAACDAVMGWRGEGGLRVRRGVIDATGIGAQIGEAMERKHKGRAEGVAFTAEFKADIFTLSRTHVEQRTIEIPDDPATLADLASIAKTVTTAGKIRFAGARTKDGHADRATALALALHAADDAPAPVATGYMIAEGGDW